jgi:glycosyltransferase involved in cell wall biosynthesis
MLVPQRSPDVLAVALEQLLRDDGLRAQLGKTARAYAEENFDAVRNAERVMQVYDRVLGQG